jgi:3-oxoacyl-[acyl-carrier protein] reductase
MSTEHGVALITGAGRGLGRAFAFALAERGFTVALTARTQAEINATAAAIARNGGRAIAVPGDVTDRQAVERAVAATEAELGPIDLLINNAGVLTGGLLGTTDPDEWRYIQTPFCVRQPSCVELCHAPRTDPGCCQHCNPSG